MPLILIVDDEKPFRLPLRSRLRRCGYQTVTAVDGEEAWVIVRDLRPDLILLDLIMPEVDGVQFLRRLRQEPSVARTPVLVLTALSDHPLTKEARRIGVQHLMLKSRFDLAELGARVAALVPPQWAAGGALAA